MENKEYVNRFKEVHKRSKLLKSRARETREKEEEHRERKAVQDAEKFFGKGEKPD